MKCPLHAQKESKYKDGIWNGVTWVFADCIREECAWWNPTYQECSIKIAACWLTLIEDNTKEIARRRPYT